MHNSLKLHPCVHNEEVSFAFDKYTLISLLLIQITVAQDLVYCPHGTLNFWISSSCGEEYFSFPPPPQESS